MDRGKTGLTVFFEGPFWVGVFGRVEDGRLSVCRVVFGSESRDYEVWEFVLKNYYGLKFSPAVKVAVKDGKVNPKRRQSVSGMVVSMGISQEWLVLFAWKGVFSCIR